MPSGWPSAIAPPLTFTRSSSRPSSRTTARLCEANASFSSTRSRSLAFTPVRASSLRTAGIGPMPITRGSTPATALPAKRMNGSAPSARARSSLAITTAAAPSLMPLELPAVTRAAGPERRPQLGERLGRGVGARVLVRLDARDVDQLVGEAPGRLRLGPAVLGAQRERILVLAADAVALGHVLARLAHALEREQLLHRRVRESPAERAVVEHAVAARERPVGLARDQRCAAHRLHAAGHEEVAVAREHGMAGRDDRREPGGAEPVDRHACDRFRQAREQRRPCARRCGCPRRPGWRSRSTRPRCRPARRPSAPRPRRSRWRRGRRDGRARARRRGARSACAPRRAGRRSS